MFENDRASFDDVSMSLALARALVALSNAASAQAGAAAAGESLRTAGWGINGVSGAPENQSRRLRKVAISTLNNLYVLISGIYRLADVMRLVAGSSRAPLVDIGSGSVMRYFDEEATMIQDTLRHNDERLGGRRIVIAGHSAGGATALVLARKLKVAFPDRPSPFVYAFGAPKAGNPQFAASLADVPKLLWANRNDAVPSIPPDQVLRDAMIAMEAEALAFEQRDWDLWARFAYNGEHLIMNDAGSIVAQRTPSFQGNRGGFRQILETLLHGNAERAMEHRTTTYVTNLQALLNQKIATSLLRRESPPLQAIPMPQRPPVGWLEDVEPNRLPRDVANVTAGAVTGLASGMEPLERLVGRPFTPAEHARFIERMFDPRMLRPNTSPDVSAILQQVSNDFFQAFIRGVPPSPAFAQALPLPLGPPFREATNRELSEIFGVDIVSPRSSLQGITLGAVRPSILSPLGPPGSLAMVSIPKALTAGPIKISTNNWGVVWMGLVISNTTTKSGAKSMAKYANMFLRRLGAGTNVASTDLINALTSFLLLAPGQTTPAYPVT